MDVGKNIKCDNKVVYPYVFPNNQINHSKCIYDPFPPRASRKQITALSLYVCIVSDVKAQIK